MQPPAATYEPIMICGCGFSFHAGNLAAHERYWHGESSPARVRLATREEHEAAGWDVSDYPRSVS